MTGKRTHEDPQPGPGLGSGQAVAPPIPAEESDSPSTDETRDSDGPDASVLLLQSEGTDSPPTRPAAPSPEFVGEESTDEAGPALDETPVVPPSDPDVAARIRELEERLDRMIGEHARGRDPEDEASLAARSQARLTRSSRPPGPDGMLEGARELLSSDFYVRKWGRLGLRNRSEEIDEFGYDPEFERRVLPLFDFLYERYFRVEVYGVDRVPDVGRCLLVANHSGTLPFDGVMLRRAVHREHAQHREVRWLAEDGIFHFPFLGTFSNRVGAVRACQENAERLLEQNALVAVFPEGVKGIGKLFKERYRLQRFGRGGFIKLGLRTRAPVVPVAIVGGEEANPMLLRIDYLTRALGIPYLPVTPTFPWLGPLGLLPAPTKWKIFFGDPIDLQGYGAESVDDELLVGRLTEQVRSEIQRTLDRALGDRRSVWFG